MGYILPSFEFLCDAASRLFNEFNIESHRYIPPKLEFLFNNTQKEMEAYVKKNGDRITQAKALLQLVLELKSDENYAIALAKNEKQYSESDRAIIDKTHKIMLGALIHRYLRIIDEYKPIKKTAGLFGGVGDYLTKKVYNPTPTNSDIFKSLASILNITAQNQLDPMTIQSACESFASFMQYKDRYTNYVHYQNDVNFISHLEAMIHKAAKAAEPELAQINKIKFLISLTKNIQEKTQDIEILLASLEKKLTEKDLPLNFEVILKHAKPLFINEEIGIRFNLLMDRPYVAEHIHRWNVVTFIEETREALYTNSRYALFGGFFMVFHQAKEFQQQLLVKSIANVLKFDKAGNEFETNSLLLSLKFLNNWFMKINIDDSTVDWTLFDGKDIGKEMFFAQYKLTKNYLSTIQKSECSQTKATI